MPSADASHSQTPGGVDSVLEAREITKDFGGTRALDRASLAVRRGEVHALVGENGAGKSTLAKIISGALQPDSGSIRLRGAAVRLDSPHHALRAGISVVHQQSGLAQDLSVAENIFLGRTPTTRLGLVDWKMLHRRAEELLDRLDFSLDVNRPAGDLDAASRQVIEIARALSVAAQVVIMDEPSAVLGSSELERLFRIIRRLRDGGTAIIYVSHRLEEIFRICDRATVMKDGRSVGTYPINGRIESSFLVRRMLGREWTERRRETSADPGREMLRVEELTTVGAFESVSLRVCAGEIVGLAGLVGAGRTELCKAIFGATPSDSGRILVRGSPARIRSPGDAVANGISYLPKDRHAEGLILTQAIGNNVTLPFLDRFARGGILRSGRENRFVDGMIGSLRIRTSGRSQPAAELSGGNQQKVALAKWLGTKSSIFLLDEPTAGVDVGAKSQIHELVAELAEQGAGILLASSDMPELFALCSRIVVMNKGRVAGHFRADEASEEDVLRLAT